MSSVNDYNAKHWSKKLPQYLSSTWSNEPSPFAQLTAAYLPPNATLLELGTGAGQDGLWLAHKVDKAVLSDAQSLAFKDISERAKARRIENIELVTLDLTQPFEFPDSSFDVVYAQLVLHYFTNEMTHAIMDEIRRVLKPGGILACMVNSVNDSEYDPALIDEDGLINIRGLMKRYFSPETFKPFVTGFEVQMLDDNGRTPKDDAVQTSGMVQFIGRKQ